jgi:hypothetical protein
MMIRKSIFKVVILFSLFATLSVTVMAQPGDPDPPDDLVPVTGIEILLLAGGALGGAKLLRKGKKD